MPDADFSQPTARAYPIGEHADQQRLAISAARDKGRQSVVLTHVIAVVMEVLSVFLQPSPTDGIDDGQRAILAARYRMAHVYVFEIDFLVDGYHRLCSLSFHLPWGGGENGKLLDRSSRDQRLTVVFGIPELT